MNQIDLFKSSFPEDLYLPATAYEIDYAQRVFFGYNIMSKNDVIIGILVRNIEEIAYHTVLRVCRLGSLFRNATVVWLENGSSDKTRESLLRLLPKSHILLGDPNEDPFNAMDNLEQMRFIDTLPYQGDKSFGRKQRMALVRNLLRNNMIKCEPSHYSIILDGDILGGFSYEGIAHSFSYDWDVCASNSLIYKNGVKLYYDSWAWRDLEHEKEHSDEEINPREYHRGDTPIRVTSAFGGLGIYKSELYHSPKYHYQDTDCDHPTIHIPMWKDGAKIIMNPSQITLFNKTRYVV